MSAWATHFSNHYCSDNEIDVLIEDTGITKSEFLETRKFPGPSIRAGDFGEILIADYLQFKLDYWVPRTRYDRKVIANESSKGSDVIAFKLMGDTASVDDELVIVEVKTQFSGKFPINRLQDAVDDSVKDFKRKAESLNAIKQRLIDRNEYANAKKVGRFQTLVDHSYKNISGAAALFSTNVFNTTSISSTNTSSHPNTTDLVLIVIHAKDFMSLVHSLYARAANEA